MKRLLALLILSAVSLTAAGGELRRVLVPTVARGEHGAFGSIWKSELWAHSTAAGRRQLRIPVVCFALCDSTTRNFDHGESEDVQLFPQPGATGLIGYTDATADELTLSFRIQDISRQTLTFGTNVPVVGEEDFRPRANLLPIPIGDRFRSTLRIYALDGSSETKVRVRAYTLSEVEPQTLAEHTIDLAAPPPLQFPETGLQFKPWYAQLDVEGLFPEAAGQDRIGLEIASATPERRIWAFVSVTNDETQHVTVVVP